MKFIKLFFSISTIPHCTLFHLDLTNAFLHGNVDEEVYMEQLSSFVTQGELFDMQVHSLYGLK